MFPNPRQFNSFSTAPPKIRVPTDRDATATLQIVSMPNGHYRAAGAHSCAGIKDSLKRILSGIRLPKYPSHREQRLGEVIVPVHPRTPLAAPPVGFVTSFRSALPDRDCHAVRAAMGGAAL